MRNLRRSFLATSMAFPLFSSWTFSEFQSNYFFVTLGETTLTNPIWARQAEIYHFILSNSVLTLYGLILAPILNLFKLRFWFWELNCSFKPKICS